MMIFHKTLLVVALLAGAVRAPRPQDTRRLTPSTSSTTTTTTTTPKPPVRLGSMDLFNLRRPHNSAAAATYVVSDRNSAGGDDTTPAPSNDIVDADTPMCGYPSCPQELDESRINVHLVAHSHDDVGWLKTVDQYYYGTKKRFNQVGVQHIYDSIVPQLMMDESKRFVAVEISFFAKWWAEQEEPMRGIVKRLVSEGRLEFINGGWCMNDEANVNYQSTIEQMTLGLKFLNETFGACGHPTVGWQIDPFGHSSEQASLFAQFGFDGMYFSRIGYLDKEARVANKSLDLVWHGDRILKGQAGSIFANVFKDGYDAPQNFCFDVQCYDDNLVDEKRSAEYNMDARGREFVAYIREYAQAKRTSHVMVPMGGDFQYSAAGQNFKNLDKLIKHLAAAEPQLHVFYSSPSCYQLALAKEIRTKSVRLPEKYDDFMPYDSSSSVWWSGYFASRPSVKLVERETANLLQVARIVSLAALLAKPASAHKRWPEDVREHEAKCLMGMWQVLGDLQHHDAVTGTEKQHVADDYVKRAVEAWNVCAKFTGDIRRYKMNEHLRRSISYETHKDTARRFKLPDPIFLEQTMLCPLLNISQCDAIEAEVDTKPYLAGLAARQATSTTTTTSTSTTSTPAPSAGGHHESESHHGVDDHHSAGGHHEADIAARNGGSNIINFFLAGASARSASPAAPEAPQPTGRSAQQPPAQESVVKNRVNTPTESRSFQAPPALKSGDFPFELATKSVLLNLYNPIAKPVAQHDIRLPCNGRCNLDKIRVIHLSTNETMKLIRLPVPSGVQTLPFRDSITTYEILFYANIPALGYTSFVVEDTNGDETVEDDADQSETLNVNDEHDPAKLRSMVRSRKIRDTSSLPDEAPVDEVAEQPKADQTPDGIEEFVLEGTKLGSFGSSAADDQQEDDDHESGEQRAKRQAPASSPTTSQPNSLDSDERIVVKFDWNAGMIVGFKRLKDNVVLNITQKFGYYYPANENKQPGAYIFRPNTSEPYLLEKPLFYKMYKRKNGALMEIHQKWADWIWQTIRIDAKKNFIEFDYVVGPIPALYSGREVVTRYLSSIANNGVFLTDSNGRQLMARHRLRSTDPTQLGGSFYPVVSTILLKNMGNQSKPSGGPSYNKHSADMLAILVDRAQAGTSLNEGQVELLIHRRQLVDDQFGVAEPLNEPGEDGRGLVTRGRHRLYLKFPDSPTDVREDRLVERKKPSLFKLPETPNTNLEFAQNFAKTRSPLPPVSKFTFIVHDPIFNDLKQAARNYALKPVITFDRLRVGAQDFVNMISTDGKIKADLSLLNTTLPNNVHLLTLQPWTSQMNEILIRLENLNNPLTIHPYPDTETYNCLLRHYKATGDYFEMDADENWENKLRATVEVDVEHLIKRIRIISLEEMTLGANSRLQDNRRLDWTGEPNSEQPSDSEDKSTIVTLAPRQIRTYLARFEHF